jgi:hypothetical protein
MAALLHYIRAAWKAVIGTHWSLERLDRVELIWLRRQHDRTAREEQFPFG